MDDTLPDDVELEENEEIVPVENAHGQPGDGENFRAAIIARMFQ